jgi:hypothetical protein
LTGLLRAGSQRHSRPSRLRHFRDSAVAGRFCRRLDNMKKVLNGETRSFFAI